MPFCCTENEGEPVFCTRCYESVSTDKVEQLAILLS
jgi:hypothetical protein